MHWPVYIITALVLAACLCEGYCLIIVSGL